MLRFRMSAKKRYIKNKKKRRKGEKEMKSIKINNMPDLPYAMEEAVNRLRINIRFSWNKNQENNDYQYRAE